MEVGSQVRILVRRMFVLAAVHEARFMVIVFGMLIDLFHSKAHLMLTAPGIIDVLMSLEFLGILKPVLTGSTLTAVVSDALLRSR